MKITILAGAVTALAVAGAGAAIAATDVLTRADDRRAVIEDAAEQLGVEPSELESALVKALQNRVDEAVESGLLTEEQGNAVKERIGSGAAPLIFGGLGRHGLVPGPFGGFGRFGPLGHFGKLERAAEYLGLTEAQLRTMLADGKSLAEIAEEQGKSVDGLIRALVAEAEERLDEAVQDGRLTQAQANEISEGLEERVRAFVNRQLCLGELSHHGPRGFGPIHVEPQGPRA